MAKKLVDVEDLMTWAAAELARKRPDGVEPRAPFAVSRADRELVGRWNDPIGHASVSPMFSPAIVRRGGARGEPPHADSLAIEAALDRLQTAAPAFDLNDALLAFGLGFALDVAGAARAALANVANLLLVHGRLSRRPELRLEPLAPSAKRAPNGKPGVWRREAWVEPTFCDHAQAVREAEVAVTALRKGLYPAGAYCGVDWTPRPQELVNERAEYAAWRAGLAWLAEEIGDTLETRIPVAPRAAARPWAGDRDGEPVPDLFGPGADRIRSSAEAAQLAAERAAGRRRPIAGGTVYGFTPVKPSDGAQEA